MLFVQTILLLMLLSGKTNYWPLKSSFAVCVCRSEQNSSDSSCSRRLAAGGTILSQQLSCKICLQLHRRRWVCCQLQEDVKGSSALLTEDWWSGSVVQNNGHFAVKYDESLAHQVLAAADILICPCFFEPSGQWPVCDHLHLHLSKQFSGGSLNISTDVLLLEAC